MIFKLILRHDDEDECLSPLCECHMTSNKEMECLEMKSHSQIPSLKEIDEGGEGCSLILS